MVDPDSTDEGANGEDESARDTDASGETSASEAVSGGLPVSGRALLLAAAKASVPGERLPELVESAQAYLAGERERYDRTFECLFEGDDAAVYLVPSGHWADLGTELGLSRQEHEALRRAHAEHARLCGSEYGRRDEVETALEIREAVVIGGQSD